MQVWLNGKFVPAQDAKVSLFDSGFQHGVGVFTSMCAQHGRVFRVMSHLKRLKTSAVELGALEVLRIEPLADAVEMTLAHNNMTEARVRITVTAGDLKMLKSPGVEGEPARNDPTIAIVVQPPTPYPAEIFERECACASQMHASIHTIHLRGIKRFGIGLDWRSCNLRRRRVVLKHFSSRPTIVHHAVQ